MCPINPLERLLNSLSEGLLENGINVTNLGLVTTPLLYYAAKKSKSKNSVSQS